MPCANVSGLPMLGCCGTPPPSGVSEHFCDAGIEGYTSFLGVNSFAVWISTYRRQRVRSACTLVLPTVPPEDLSWTHEYYDEFSLGGGTVRVTVVKTPAEPEFTARVNRMQQVTPDAFATYNASATVWDEIVNSALHGAFATHHVTLELPNPSPLDLIGIVNQFDPASLPVGQAQYHFAPAPFVNQQSPDGFITAPDGRMRLEFSGTVFFSTLPPTGQFSGSQAHNPSSNIHSIRVLARNYRMASAGQWGKATKSRRIWRSGLPLAQYACLGQIPPPVNHVILCEQGSPDADLTEGSVALFALQADATCP